MNVEICMLSSNDHYPVVISIINMHYLILVMPVCMVLTTCTFPQVEAAEQNFLGFVLSVMCMFGLSFLAASFILYPVTENSSKVCTYVLVYNCSAQVCYCDYGVFIG